MRYLFVLNPKAGRKKNVQDLVAYIDSKMSKSGRTYEFAFTTGAGDATRIAADGADEGFDVVVAVGGDGTVNEVASGLINKKTALGIIPLGSGNGIARSLSIPQMMPESISSLILNRIKIIDVGIINDKYFIGVAGCGYDALVGQKFDQFGARGPLPYFFISVREYFSYQCQKYTIILDEEALQTAALLVTFANTREFGNGAVIAPNADPADGYLDVCIMKPQSPLGAIRAASMLFNNSIDEHPGLITRKCQKVMLRSESEDIYVHRDGEPDKNANELNVQIVKRALRVCTPLGPLL
jgi:YegS/Rv2252/BmrU family lipid kinase